MLGNTDGIFWWLHVGWDGGVDIAFDRRPILVKPFVPLIPSATSLSCSPFVLILPSIGRRHFLAVAGTCSSLYYLSFRSRLDPPFSWSSSACSVGWFVSLLVCEEVLLAGLCERKILFWLKIYDRLRQATAKRIGCLSLVSAPWKGDVDWTLHCITCLPE